MIFLLLFLISSTLRSSDAQKPKPKNTLCACRDLFYEAQPIRNAAENYNIFLTDFFGWVKIWKMMKIHKKFCVLKFPKIREKVILQQLDRGMNKIKKNIYFSNSTSFNSSFLLPYVMEFQYYPFQRQLFLGHPNVQCTLACTKFF